jgi:hypothetical protein
LYSKVYSPILLQLVPAIYITTANTSAVFDGVNVINSTFIHLKSFYNSPTAIHIQFPSGNINISYSFFTNISSSYASSSNNYCGIICYNMSSTGNGYYNIRGNTFSEISTNKSVLVLGGTFSSLLFSYNTFYNVSSTNEGGVLFFIFL